MQSSSPRASFPFAADASSRGELTPIVPSFSRVDKASSAPGPLESLERYKLLARIGQGGMAEVFLAAWEVAPFVHRPMVIKRLYPHFNEDPRLVEMFLDEARLLTQLDHPHIVKTFEAGVIDGRCCIAMEYLEGQPLQRVLRRANERGGLEAHVAVSIAIAVLDGLHYSHELEDAHGLPLAIVHRDVSPQNVFVSNSGDVKVLDFGIAKANSQEGRTATGIVKGKVGYIAPEQARAERVDRRADVWSAGVVLWESLTGCRLFKAESDAATLGLTLQGQIPRAGSQRLGVPEELEGVLVRALQRDPALRYQSAGAMRKDLESWLARAGFSRDARKVCGVMQDLFATEIVEQQRLASVLMARSDCTPPAPASTRTPSSTSALYLNLPQAAATSADLTRINEQMVELGKRHRRAFHSMFLLLGAFVAMTCLTVYLAMSRASMSSLRATADSPLAPPVAAQNLEPRKLHAPPIARLQSAGANEPKVAPSFGFLTIDTNPWSVVSVGSKVLGQTPLIGVRLPSGSQVLSLKNPELGIDASYPVTIESGKTTVRRLGIE